MASATKECRYCRTEINKKASVCPQCGKRLGTHPLVGCLAILLLLVMGTCVAGMCAISTTPSGGSRTTAPPPAAPPTTETYTLSDGSTLTLTNVRPVADWACGPRKTATMQLPNGQGGGVTVYLDRAGNLVSINVQGAGNEVLHNAQPGKQCLQNWVTRQMEMLTEAEYQRLEKEAGI